MAATQSPSTRSWRHSPLVYVVVIVFGTVMTGLAFFQQRHSEKRNLFDQFDRDSKLCANLIQHHLKERLSADSERNDLLDVDASGVFSIADTLSEPISLMKPIRLPFDIFDRSAVPERRLLFRWNAHLSSEPMWTDRFLPTPPTYSRAFDFCGHSLEILFQPDNAYIRHHYNLMCWSALPIGLGITALICLIIRSIRIRGKLLERIVAERTVELHHYQANLELLVEQRSAEILRANERLQEEVTDRKLAEIQLQNSEMRLRSILDSTAEAIYGIDTEGKCMFCNRACLDMLGYKNLEDLLGKNMHWLIHHSHADGTHFSIEECPIFRSFKDGIGTHVEDDVLWRADGSSFSAEYWSYPQRVGDRIVGSVVAFVDITERKLAQDALKSSEERLRAIYEGSSDAFFLIADDGCFIDCNLAAVKMLGYAAKDEIIGLHPFDILQPTQPNGQKSLRFSKERIHNAFQFGTDHFEVEHRRKDGSQFPAEVLLTAFDYGGQRVIQATVRDITLRKNAEKELRKLSVAVEQNPATIVITDRQGNIEYVNAKFCETTGYSYAEAIGQNPRILKSGQINSPEDYKDLWNTLLSGREWRGEFHNRKKSGELFWEQALIAPIKDEMGRITHFIAIKEDVTQRKENEDVLRKALSELASINKDLKKANQIKSLFLATMSHEIRTPLNAIIGMTGLLLDTPLDDEQNDQAETIRKSAEILLALINDILDFSKIEAEKVELEKQPFDLRRCVEDSRDLLAGKAKSKNIALSCELQPDLPAYFEGDVTRLRQILVNLISNAVKFTLEGSVKISVTGKPEKDERYLLHFQVQDTGIGIPENVRDRLFKPFSQGDTSTNRRFGGTGLGLAICKRLCELMGGRIWVESDCGVHGGSTFHFTIDAFATAMPPAWASSDGPEKCEEDSRLAPNNAGSTFKPDNLKILLAEDNLVNQKVALKMLDKLGYRADVVSNGLEVLSALSRIHYDVILMDCQMPEMDGYEATLQIRASELSSKSPAVRIIAMTAHAMKGDEEECLASGMNDYLSKPVRETELRRSLQKCRPLASPMPEEPNPTSESIPPEADIEELLDSITLQEMADIDVADIVELVELFRTQTKELLTELNSAVGAADPREVNRIAHKLAGSSAACGLKAVIAPLRELEKRGKEGNIERIGDLLDRIDRLLKSSDAALDRYIEELRNR